jgi:molybdopterin converting factor small subunit
MGDSMHIRVRVAGHIAEYFPGGRREFDLTPPDGCTVATLLHELGVRPGLVMGVTVGGVRRPLSYAPVDGDTIVVLSPPAGG